MNDEWRRFEPLLRSGERLRWAGRPDPAVRFTQADIFVVPISLMWCGFAIVWVSIAISRGAPLFFVLWGIPFVLVGLFFVFGRFIQKKRRKLTTVYGLTDSRAIVSAGKRSVQDVPLDGAPIHISRSRDGRHVTVMFGTGKPNVYQNTGMDVLQFGPAPTVAFFDVADPDSLTRELDAVRQRPQR